MWLRQSTAVTIKLGPFVDDTDGKTAETGLTVSQADVRLSKNGGDMAQKNDTAACAHDEIGYYDCALNATDTGTLGRLRVMVAEAGALPVWADFMVVPGQVWDSLFGADRLQVHADEITAGLITAEAIAAGAIDADALATDAVSEIQSGLATAAALETVAGYVDTEVAAIKAKTDGLPSDPADQSAVEAAITAAVSGIADAVWDEALSGHATAGSAGEALAGIDLAGVVDVAVGEVTAGVEPTTVGGLLRMIYNRFYRRNELTATTLRTYVMDGAGGGSGVLCSQTVSDDGTTQIQQQATYPG